MYSPLHRWTTFLSFIAQAQTERQTVEGIWVELRYVDTVWSFISSAVAPVQTLYSPYVSHSAASSRFFLWTPSYWILLAKCLTKPPYGNWFEIPYRTCQPIIYNDRGTFYSFLCGSIRRRHSVVFHFLSQTSKKKLYIFMTQSIFWTDLLWIFSHPILGRTFPLCWGGSFFFSCYGLYFE